ncbi:HigA family addiction module antitoxin [Ralstonia sp. NFACC01]|uniref:HigA family addiction module antitoxin n=1 Tax=Ralstonia sp. NFACC01 TaxID=1566294 RepID=UPI0008E34802|nr:HigA family addiction module antitoxin [Ralstonia sp. NFACC01]SFO86774.1 addiction module antidote protein, HigA family [Ralstonia sp. NFACC01]
MSKATGIPDRGSDAPNASIPSHPGQHIRSSVLAPRKLSVVAAAKLVGVGRPALSNLLNGHAAVTPQMASRIEIAFGIPAQDLLDMQAAYDAAQSKAKGVPADAMPYVPPFLGIKATDIEKWVVRNIAARTRFSVLLRTLANSTCDGITKIDFPGNDDAERPGWDGYIVSTRATPWIPEGMSGWEFGVNEDVKGKADGDFAKSVKALKKEERDQTTFVFVTPRHWPAKDKWIETNKAKGLWKDVRAYDSSDLEQWFEQSLSAQTWFANETEHDSEGVRSLDKCWRDWANVANPPLSGSLFASSVASAERTLLPLLRKQPEAPVVIAADSTEEALAFLAQLFSPAGGDELASFRDRVLVIDKQGVLPKLAQGAKNFIAVAANTAVERELGPFTRLIHTIVVCPRNAANANPDIVLEPVNYEAFRSALEAMGYGRDDVTRYSNESGRSLTVLRRRLANVPGVRTPEWAADHQVAHSLAPFLLIGAWNATNPADQTALTLLAGAKSYEALEKEFQRLARLNDAPVWSVGTYRGVVSKIDLLFAIAGSMTEQDIRNYLDVAGIVLGEDDPKLDLPDDKRWTASIYGKSREFSSALRQGISETMVLLAVHGNFLFQARLGFDCSAAVTRLVEQLLTPLNTRILEANDRDLTAYAEASPEAFLSILEDDLQKSDPACYGLMRPAGTGVFGGCPRTGLLWALEGLAWNPHLLSRAALILAQLAGIEINDNWSNKPIRSLAAIFRAWMPQTAADHDARLGVLKLLAKRFPEVAWRICMDQLSAGPQTGDYSHKPKWRTDAHGFGEPLKTWALIHAFVRATIDIVLDWQNGYSREMLCDLIERLYVLPEEHQTEVWNLVKTWAEAGASDRDKAFVCEKIRTTILSRRGAARAKTKGEFAKLSAAAIIARRQLEPTDLLNKHEWLFRQHWVQTSADELQDGEMDFGKREEHIAQLRTNALQQILEVHGLAGIFDLAEIGNAATSIGILMMQRILPKTDVPDFLLTALSSSTEDLTRNRKNLIVGATRALEEGKQLVDTLKRVQDALPEGDFLQLLLLSPFRRSCWQIVDELQSELGRKYWDTVTPEWIFGVDDECIEAVERLLTAGRPRAAFACAQYKFEVLGPELLFRVMWEIAHKQGRDQSGQFQLDQYYVQEAFSIIDRSTALTLEQKAGLEFAYIDALSTPWGRGEKHGVPNLQKYVEEHPEMYVQAVVWTYKRGDEGEDPPNWKVAPDQVQHLAERGYKLLDGLDRVPGHDEKGELQASLLAEWVKAVRDGCAELGRLDIADVCIGKLLSHAPVGNDGIWPCAPVRDVMEDVHSKAMMEGVRTGLYNSRGAVWRGEGGDQERSQAEKYRPWANALQYTHPFVATEVLMGMVATYEQEAVREDARAGIVRRMR